MREFFNCIILNSQRPFKRLIGFSLAKSMVIIRVASLGIKVIQIIQVLVNHCALKRTALRKQIENLKSSLF